MQFCTARDFKSHLRRAAVWHGSIGYGHSGMKRLAVGLVSVLFLLAAIVLVRTALFASKQMRVSPPPPTAIDRQRIAQRLSEAVQFRTVSHSDPARFDGKEFLRFHQFLKRSFPLVHARLLREVVGDYSLLYSWKGEREDLKPILLTAHMDVVPAAAETEPNWNHPPFSGRVADGYIWGRGTLDDKASLLGLLEAVEYLLHAGFRPRRTHYLAFGHDEEVGGRGGAARIAELLSQRNIDLEYVLDEGGFVIDGAAPVILPLVALVGIAEKGYLSLELNVNAPGGHSSIPPAQTAIGILAAAIHKLESRPFPARIRGATAKLFEHLGPELPWPKKMIGANLWLFSSWVEREMAKSPVANAMIRTTLAATIFESGIQDNVLPTRARAVVNLRILTGESPAAVIEHLRRTIDDARIVITPLKPIVEPSRVSEVDTASFALLNRTIREIFSGIAVAPALLVAATDARHYSKRSNNVYRFAPIKLRDGDFRRFHGVNERINLDDYERIVRFYIQLMRNADS